jgi:hypothetical protein
MKNTSHPLRRLAVALCALAASAALLAEGETSRIKFSDPSKPGTFKMSLAWADVKVTGTDGSEIVVSSSVEKKKEKGEEVDADGFRRLDDDVNFELKEKNNVVTLSMSGDQQWFSHGTEFEIQVPRNTNLVLRTQLGGDIVVSNIDGDVDINSMNGEVFLSDISSSAVVNTMNGEVTASYSKAPVKPVSITSMNGEVDVRLPADTKANLRLRSHNGSIRTNFPDGVLKTKSERASRPFPSEDIVVAPEAPEAPEAAAAPEAAVAPEAPTPHEKHEGYKSRAVQLKDLPPEEQARVAAQIERAARHAAGNATRNAISAIANIPGAIFAGRNPAFGKSITGTLNGGGIDISLSSMNGTITLRQAK